LNADDYFFSLPTCPFDRFPISGASLNADAGGEKSTSVNLYQLAAHPICLKPMDARYKIDLRSAFEGPVAKRKSDRIELGIVGRSTKIQITSDHAAARRTDDNRNAAG
jgi:hypothetical protein